MSDHPFTSGTSLPNLAPVRNDLSNPGIGAGMGMSMGTGTGMDPDAMASSSRPFTDAQVEEFREQDRWLPIANVARIMKSSLPPSAKVSKEAKECVQECVSEFISFITSEAAEKCLNEKRKTLNGEDILTSMRALGFDNYEGVLRVYLAKYRDAHHALPKRHTAAEDDSDENANGTGTGNAAPPEGAVQRKKRGRGRVSAATTASVSTSISATGANTPTPVSHGHGHAGPKRKKTGDEGL